MAKVVLFQVSTDIRNHLRDVLDPAISVETINDSEHLYLEMRTNAQPAEALVLGVSAKEPVSIAQQVCAYRQDVSILMLSAPDRCAQLAQAIQFSPFLGGEVQIESLTALDNLEQTLTDSVQRIKKRRRYRGSIQAAQRHMEELVRTPPPLTHYLDRLIHHAPVGVLNVDANGIVLNINRGACQVLKIAERDAVGSLVKNLFPVDEHDRLSDLIARCVAPLKAHRAEVFQIKTTDTNACFVEMTTTSLIDRSGMLGCTVMLQDVTDRINAQTERERAEQDLRKSESQLRLITDSLPILISYVDPDHRYCFNNKAYENWFGSSSTTLSGRHVSEVIGVAAYENLKPHLDLALSGHVIDFETRLPYSRGGDRYVRGHMSPDFANNGLVQGVVTTVSDITQSKHAEEREKQHLQELAHVSRVATLGEMSSQLAHELAQPITAIANFADASLRNLNNPETAYENVAETLTDIAAMADRARDIINQLRNFIQKKEIQRLPEDVNDLVKDVLRLERTEARWHGLDLDLNLDPTLPPVMADKTLIEQVILNLVRNAIESILHSENKQNALKIQTSRDCDAVQVAVSDTGLGLRDDAIQRLFEPFFTTKQAGLGMGLAISRSIVDAHGGRLWAENNLSRGATFRFTLAAQS